MLYMGLESFQGESPRKDMRHEHRADSPLSDVEYTPSDIENKSLSDEKMKGLFIGLVIGEGSFSITIRPRKLYASAKFSITQHEENIDLLNYIQEETGLGQVTQKNKDIHYHYRILDAEECKNMAIWFEENAGDTIFDKTAKYESFKLWCECLSMIIDGVSNDKEAIIKLAELRDDMNRDSRGRSSEEIKEIVNQQ